MAGERSRKAGRGGSGNGGARGGGGAGPAIHGRGANARLARKSALKNELKELEERIAELVGCASGISG